MGVRRGPRVTPILLTLENAAVYAAAAQGEQAFQRQVIEFARLHRWRTAHFRPGMDRRGQWKTAVQGDGAGFPDLVLVRERLVFAELKAVGGKLRPDQTAWRDALRAAGVEWHEWRPTDWPQIEEALR